MRLDHLLSKEEKVRVVLLLSYHSEKNFSVAMRIRETPVPIPNTMVKTYPAEDTARATLWESRWLPNFKKLNNDKIQERILYDMIV